ncbi:DUF4838 domain-containing protein [Maribellus luteus]|uniref:DUF4838 domain-containing protein n=1 Tax=Maribellus luteus TaxID=2305463 RepID=A0A399T085_9BACT|nr:DUF4838 domain-containing protein [Maribellus luteus]RIJ48035.1 DUF4838 domain-containing protein [Maribellus luteus]
MNRLKLLKTNMLLLIFVCLLLSSAAQSTKLKPGEWLRDWYLAGPFPLVESTNENKHLPDFDIDFLKKVGGEAKVLVREGAPVKFKGATVRWKKHESPESVVDLDREITRSSYVTAYAYTEVESDDEGIYIFSLGTDDGGRLWVNGQQVWDCTKARAVAPDDDLIPVRILKGKNTILLKVEERTSAWAFTARFLPFNLSDFVNGQQLFDVSVKKDGSALLKSSVQKPVLDLLFKNIDAKVTTDKGKEEVWQGNWDFGKDLVLPISKRYQENKLTISATLTNGSPWQKEISFYSGMPSLYTLFKDRATPYRIIVAADASESEQWAAQELQHWLAKISKATFPIKTDDEEITGHEIIVGYNKRSLALLGGNVEIPAETDDSYVYQNINENILLLGGKQRGAMYAVFSFLENELGCRWYTSRVSVIPEWNDYTFKYLNHAESPSIRVRNDFYHEAFEPVWAARNKVNGAMNFREQHGGVEGYWGVHTFYQFMPPSEFFGAHPEYYSLIDGKRTHERAQLCLTNPDVLDIITERLKKVMRENPGSLIYSVSQNDWYSPCQCEKCQSIVKEEKSESGLMIWFVNQVAERIKDEFPGKYVGTLAYQYTRKPPQNIKPRENVVVRLCSIECCFAHDFKSCPQNKDFLEDLQGWAAIAPHMYIWDYVVSFTEYVLPFPNFNVLQPNIKTFQENNAIGIMEQAAYQSRGGEFAELRAYLIAKLLWNSEIDVNTVVDDFMAGYYGRSGQYIRSYFDLLQNIVTPETHFGCYLRHDDNLFTSEFAIEAEKLLDKAERVADNDEILKRVEMARLPLMYLKCVKNPVEAKIDGTYDRFCRIVEREGITHLSERGDAYVKRFHENVKNAE